MPIEPPDSHPDDAGIEDLLREVGARVVPSAEATRVTEAAVHAEWHAMLEQQRRRVRTQRIGWGIAAGMLLVLAVAFLGLRVDGPGSNEVAAVARIDGHLLAGPRADDLEARLSGTRIRLGETLQTDGRSRAALVLGSGLSLRLDSDTTVTFAAADRVELRSGALYIDASADVSGAAALTVKAAAGAVRHIGTQYQVRTHADGIAVSVREGRVLIEHEGGSSVGGAGESIRVSTQGEITRAPISGQDASWSWAAQAAPRFDIENQTLAAFLEWLARETGRRVAYASPQAETAARTLRLRGSIEGLDLETALGAVLSTTQLRRYETGPDAIGITMAPIDSATGTRPTH